LEKEFLSLINEHQPILLKICRMYCDDKDDREDLFQEILVELWKSYPKFNGHSKFSTWMYRVGLNVAITSFRVRKKRPDKDQITVANENVPLGESERLDLIFGRELQAAIDVLNKFDKALVMLYLDEKSYREISEIMGITESNVGVKINRIKKQLYEILKP
jgi:RNA polymerase sigma-70 factor, ECF subfamily